MIVDDLDIECIAMGKAKADSPLFVDPDRMLPSTVASQRFKSIGRRQPQIFDPGCSIQLPQPHGRAPQYVARKPTRFANGEKPLGLGIRKRPDHRPRHKQIVYERQEEKLSGTRSRFAM